MMTACGVVLGVVSHGMVNIMRRKPVSFEPWWHLISAVVGGVALNRLAHVYDDTTDFTSKQIGSYSRLPAWVHPQLTKDELDSELRPERVEQYRKTWEALASAEEAEYIKQRA